MASGLLALQGKFFWSLSMSLTTFSSRAPSHSTGWSSQRSGIGAEHFAQLVGQSLTHVFGAHRAVFTDRRGEQTVHFVNWPAWCQAHYCKHERKGDPIASWLNSGQVHEDGGVVRLSDLVPRRALLQASYFEHMLRPTHSSFVLTLALCQDRDVAGAVSLVRDTSTRDFSADERAMARSMVPLLTLAYRAMDQERDLAQGVHEPTSAPSAFGRLTPREREIAQWAQQGLSNKVIARRVGTSHWTVKNQLRAVFEKTGVNNRTALAALVNPVRPTGS